MSDGVRCMWMRGGSSKGGFFLADDLPATPAERDAFLLRVMGSPDARQIDGMGGADPLTSKVAVISRSQRQDADVDYLFLQVFVDQAIVSDRQNCGNILAAVGPFAIERGLVAARDGITDVRIFMHNSGQLACAQVATPAGKVSYEGDICIDGVPGYAAAVPITFANTAGASCGALLPTGNNYDLIDGIPVTLIDNGMPVVVVLASDVGVTGGETCQQLEADNALAERLESIRRQAGPLMNLGDVSQQSVPKLSLVSRPCQGGALSTRTFIPHRCHAAIGVLGAVSVATAAILPGSPAAALVNLPKAAGNTLTMSIEHPSGQMSVRLTRNYQGDVTHAAILRTARKLFDGRVFVHDNQFISQ